MRVKELFNFIRERHAVYERRMAGQPKPWTTDPVLQNYRFCSVYRELDTVTQWIATNWRDNHVGDSDIWFAMCIARLANWPETLAELEPAVFSAKTGKVIWRPEKFVRIMQTRKMRGEKVFSGAYIVSTNGFAMDKAEYLAEHVLTPLWHARKHLRPFQDAPLYLWHEALMDYDGMGSFMAGQVVADWKYAPMYLHKAPDWWTFAAEGPGSKRGLNRVLGATVDAPWSGPRRWIDALWELQDAIDPLIEKVGMPRLHAQDLQNCLCEFDKYERVRLGEGAPRSRYPGI